jgi:hypothetical protein
VQTYTASETVSWSLQADRPPLSGPR